MEDHYQQQQQQRHHIANTFDFYRFLILKGASTRVRDFRGKTPDYYAKHQAQLRAKSIIHLANKLNANYQATVLSRTLQAMTFKNSTDLLIGDGDDYKEERDESLFGTQHHNGPFKFEEQKGHQNQTGPSENRESMSVSCTDLSKCTTQRGSTSAGKLGRASGSSKSLTNLNQEDLYIGQEESHDGLEMIESASRELGSSCSNGAGRSSSLCSSPIISDRSQQSNSDEPILKRLIKDRSSRMILDQKRKLLIRRQLNEGKIDQINQLLVEGYGGQLLDEAPVACWNQQCRHYVLKIVPSLLDQLDALHELIATNQFGPMKKMLEQSVSTMARLAVLSNRFVAVALCSPG